MYCPANCANFFLIGNPTAGCDLTALRKRTLSRIAFMSCSADIPDPVTEQNAPGLFNAGDAVIVVSNPLVMTVNDPEQEEIVVHSCMPPIKVTNRRVISFEDKIKVEIPADVDNNVTANPFYDYDFWKDKKSKRLMLRYGLVYCNGDFVFARNEDGSYMEAWFDVFLAYSALANNGGTLEIKKGTLEFQGDPLDFAKPDFNLVDLGIEL